ncbi:hypothetical protein [Mycolicibacterium rhodesiae]|nr:hypothetical protein [Mycolicibacterium rhodesiae]
MESRLDDAARWRAEQRRLARGAEQRLIEEAESLVYGKQNNLAEDSEY